MDRADGAAGRGRAIRHPPSQLVAAEARGDAATPSPLFPASSHTSLTPPPYTLPDTLHGTHGGFSTSFNPHTNDMNKLTSLRVVSGPTRYA